MFVHAGSRTRQRVSGALLLPALGVSLLASMVISVGVGPVFIPPETVVGIVGAKLGIAGDPASWTSAETNIVWLLRLPRVIAGAFVGAALSVAGAVIQALVRNPLADPYLLGISSGASAGAATQILFVASAAGATALAGSAFLGALLAIALVFALARVGGQLVPSRLVFAGIAVGFALGALTNLLVFLSNSRDGVRAVLFWMLGSLGQSRWDTLGLLCLSTVVTFVLLLGWSRRLDAISLGEDTARSLGTHPIRFRALATAVVALCVAVAVSVSGAIGFVGLVVPHVARRLVGAQHRLVLPASALIGALVLIWADALARTAFDPTELPLGVLTALLGTPLLIALVHRMSAAR